MERLIQIQKLMGEGLNYLKKAGIETSVGLLKNECKELNRFFLPIKKNLVPTSSLKVLNHLTGKLPFKTEKATGSPILNREKIVISFDQELKGIWWEEIRQNMTIPALTVRLTKNELGLAKGEAIVQPVKIILGNLKKSKKVTKFFLTMQKLLLDLEQSAKKSKNVEYLEYKEKIFLKNFCKIF